MLKTNVLIAAFVTASLASAGTVLTGLQVISTDAEGNSDVQAPHAWNTKATNARGKIFLVKAQKDGPILNGPTFSDAALNIPMTGGTHTYYMFAEPIYSVLKPRYSLNFFFDLEQAPKISIFAPLNTASNEYFPEWYPVALDKRTNTMDGPNAKSTGKAEWISGQTKVVVKDFSFSAPNIFKLDRVDYSKASPSKDLDFVGHFTIEVSAPPEISSGGVVNAASFTPRIAPGSLVSIFGTDLATTQATATSVPLPLSLAGTSVTIGGKDAPLVFVSAGQINAQVPYELAENTSAEVVVKVNGVTSPKRNVQVVRAAPGIFQFGEKRAVVQNADFSVNTADNPADTNSYVVAYLTGCGNVDHAVTTGGPAAAEPLSRPKSVVTATVGGLQAEVAFAGLTPGFIGLMQVNLKVPGLPAGTHPLLISIDGVQSNSAMITVR